MKFGYLIEPPFNYKSTNGYVTGCDVEVARFVLNQLNIRSFMPVEAEFSDLLPGLSNGSWNMTTGMFEMGTIQSVSAE